MARRSFDEWVTSGPMWQVVPTLFALFALAVVLIAVPIVAFVSHGARMHCEAACELRGSTMEMRNTYGCFCADGQHFPERR